jgi:hypothetical protein
VSAEEYARPTNPWQADTVMRIAKGQWKERALKAEAELNRLLGQFRLALSRAEEAAHNDGQVVPDRQGCPHQGTPCEICGGGAPIDGGEEDPQESGQG